MNLVQIFLSGGVIGWAIILVSLLGWIGCLRTWRRGSRRSAILLPTLFAAGPILLGVMGTLYGYMWIDRNVASLRARPTPPSEAMIAQEVSYSETLAWSTTISGAIFTLTFILIALLAVAVKRDPPAE